MTMRITIGPDDAPALRAAAYASGTSVEAIVARAIKAYLQRYK